MGGGGLGSLMYRWEAWGKVAMAQRRKLRGDMGGEWGGII